MAIAASLLSEFIGTFALVLAVGCNVAGNTPLAVTSIAFTLMVCIYALAGVSGANFNPAVSLSLGMAGKLPWVMVLAYWCAQCAGAGFAGFASERLCRADPGGRRPQLLLVEGHELEAFAAEALFTAMLCFVVLSVAAAKRNQPNGHFGLAIGLAVVAGGHAASRVSGGLLNPAVALGLLASSGGANAGSLPIFVAGELMGAMLAYGLYFLVHPGETVKGRGVWYPSIVEKCAAEFVGTFYLVLTVGLTVLSGDPLAAWSIAACLASMVYAVGCVSGAHLNPSVTLAFAVHGQGSVDSLAMVGAQLLGGGMGARGAATLLVQTSPSRRLTLAVGRGFELPNAAAAEFAFTTLLCFVCLCISAVKGNDVRDVVGLTVGSCITAGGFCVGRISMACLNPAVSMALAGSGVLSGNTVCSVAMPLLVYLTAELAAAPAAAALFAGTHLSSVEAETEHLCARADEECGYASAWPQECRRAKAGEGPPEAPTAKPGPEPAEGMGSAGEWPAPDAAAEEAPGPAVA